jgi:putative transposase
LNGKLRDGLLNREIFYTLNEAQVIIERWRQEYNIYRPHTPLEYRPPAAEAVLTASEMSLKSWLMGKRLEMQIVPRLS